MVLPKQSDCLPALAALFTGLCLLTSPARAGDFPVADRVIVEKENRKLHLMSDGDVFRVT